MTVCDVLTGFGFAAGRLSSGHYARVGADGGRWTGAETVAWRSHVLQAGAVAQTAGRRREMAGRGVWNRQAKEEKQKLNCGEGMKEVECR